MLKKIKIAASIFAWLVVGLSQGAALNASWRVEFHELYQSPREALGGRNFTLAMSLAGPFLIPAAFIFTGGYVDGWTLSGKPFPCTADYPDIWCK